MFYIVLLGGILSMAMFVHTRRSGPPLVMLLVTALVVFMAPPALLEGDITNGFDERRNVGVGEESSRKDSSPSVEHSGGGQAGKVVDDAWADVTSAGIYVAAGAVALLVLALLVLVIIPALARRGRESKRTFEERATRRRALQAKQAADREQWQALGQEVQSLTQRIMGYRTDVEAILRMPLIVDVTDASTSAAYRLSALCEKLAKAQCPSLDMGVEITSTDLFVKVQEFRHAVEVAEANAKKVGVRQYTPEQRKALQRARQLWARAKDTTSDNEREVSIKRLYAEVEDIVSLPKEAVQAIDHVRHLALEAPPVQPREGTVLAK